MNGQNTQICGLKIKQNQRQVHNVPSIWKHRQRSECVRGGSRDEFIEACIPLGEEWKGGRKRFCYRPGLYITFHMVNGPLARGKGGGGGKGQGIAGTSSSSLHMFPI